MNHFEENLISFQKMIKRLIRVKLKSTKKEGKPQKNIEDHKKISRKTQKKGENSVRLLA